jgi:RNA polymerase sigma factor (sigma-70 family)
MTEAELDRADMRKLQGGNAQALDSIMHRWQIRLRGYLMRHGLSDADACDLAQETFVRVFRHASRFDPRRRFSTWMFQIALNLLRDQLRRQQRRDLQPLDAAPETSTSESPATTTETSERATTVRLAIEALPPRLREVLILSVYQQLSQAEVAEIVGASTKAVETRLYRAREKLRQSLASQLE